MLNTISRNSLIGGWSAMLVVVLALSMWMGANLSTYAMLLALGVAGPVIIVLLGGGAPSRTVSEILHSADAKDGR